MSRVAAWQKKKSTHWLATREELSHTTLYLVNRLGPTVFSVRDDSLNTYKVILGNPHSCTCGSLATDELCVHQLYCLIKVLRIHEEHPLIYQLGITDPETESVLSGQCGPPTGLDRSAHPGSGSVIENRSAAARARRKARQKEEADPESPTRNSEFVCRQLLGEGTGGPGPGEEEDICPICQDGMNRDQALTWCRKGCGNNIHAKCMQTFAQYKISSHAQVECPLCRAEWNIALLKDDLRGKATLKNSCAPVYCTQCTMPVRSGPFFRCVECSQRRAFAALREERRLLNQSAGGITPADAAREGAGLGGTVRLNHGVSATSAIFTDVAQFREQAREQAALASERAESRAASAGTGKRCADFCTRCFEHALGKEHLVHHFISSDAGTNVDDDVEWAVETNPLQRAAGHDASVMLYEAHTGAGSSRSSSANYGVRPDLAALQDREITMDDYNMLLELDEVAKAASVSEHLAASLPKADVPARNADANDLSHSPYRSVAAAAAAQSGKLCWCKVSAEVAVGMNISGIATAKLKGLPCGHIAHDRCIHTALDAAKTNEAIPYASFRCRHEGCRALLFPSLQRSRKKTKKTAGGTSEKKRGSGSGASVASAMTEDSVFGLGALSVSGFSQPLIHGNFGVARAEGFGALLASSRGTALVPVAATADPHTHTHTHTRVTRTATANVTSSQPTAATHTHELSDMDWDIGAPEVAPLSLGSTASIASLGGLSGMSYSGERSVGGYIGGGAVRKGRPKGKFDARAPTPPKPVSNTFGDIHHPANPLRGRQRYHQSPLAPVGGIHTRTLPRTAPVPISQQEMTR